MIEFREAGHIYIVDGRQVVCVSDLCRFISREIYTGDVPKWQMEAAAERGTAVHAATERLEALGIAELDDEYAPYLQAYTAFLRDHEVLWELTEKSLYSAKNDFAGTIDRYGLLDGKKTLLDIKTTYTVYKVLCEASLNLYRRLLEESGFEVEQLVILHLQKNGQYKLVVIPISERLPDALLTLNTALVKRRKGAKK